MEQVEPSPAQCFISASGKLRPSISIPPAVNNRLLRDRRRCSPPCVFVCVKTAMELQFTPVEVICL